ncbi:MAG: Iron-regulated ABC transporter ATPase subunit SufC [Parcubacteria group bacterium GW2011_GWA2_44_12]|nr:MAG: Iron-regulated ABC transporter ATPase subunit SufC [Parcubacteria group bacterium GW2011_GWA2_44_12]
MAGELAIKQLCVKVEGKEILKGVSMTARTGEIHAIMGPNGSGKSTLAYTLMGHPRYEVTGGSVSYKGADILSLPAEDRARLGIFLAFQYPLEVPGVSMIDYLKTARDAMRGTGESAHIEPKAFETTYSKKLEKERSSALSAFRKELSATLKTLNMKDDFMERYLNEGFSGGEKKKAEILQMAVLRPSLIILDETDSGLDVDALRFVAEGVNILRDKDSTVIVITHYQRILNYIIPSHVHILKDGAITQSGGPELARKVEGKGYI